jgi:hypothetical protein
VEMVSALAVRNRSSNEPSSSPLLPLMFVLAQVALPEGAGLVPSGRRCVKNGRPADLRSFRLYRRRFAPG